MPRHPTLLLLLLLCLFPAMVDARDHWAFQPPVRHELPTTAENPIDAFVRAKLDGKNLPVSPEADPHTLLRRLHLDLTGLLPSPDEGEAFMAAVKRDPVKARRDIVEKLLASPHYGERWGRHWLDLARYGESDGYLGDTERRWAWRYRDWVVAAVNRDQPYDQFSIEQLAGDLIPDATAEQKIAVGFHRNALRNTEAGVDKELNRTKEVIDRVNATATTWLALTLACAECHNHKHDPLKQDEFFSFYAFFNNLEDSDPTIPLPGEMERYETALATWEKSLAPLEAALAKDEKEALPARLAAWEKSLVPLPPIVDWRVLKPSKAESGASDAMKILDDGAIAVAGRSGKTPDTVTYTVEAAIPDKATTISAIQLEVIGSPGSGREPGLTAGRGKDGAFVLSSFSARFEANSEKAGPLVLESVAVSDSDPKSDPNEVLNAKSTSGWSVSSRTRQSHLAVFRLKEPLTLEPGGRLIFTLGNKAPGGSSLRQFRLSATSAAGLREPSPVPATVRVALAIEAGKRSEAQRELVAAFHRGIDPTWSGLRLAIDHHLAKAPAKPASRVQSLTERMEERRESFVHVRGDYTRRGETVTPGVPAVLHDLKTRTPGATADRLDLAHWLFDEANSLTARVAVNQIWQHLFGVGLVSTSDDFGTEGATPSHPELLDWLATEYRRLGWSRKALIRLIVDSEIYRKSSRLPAGPDLESPDNTLLWRQNSFRVDAEVVRDIHLTASGLLSRKVGGESVYPPLPGFVTEVGRSVKWPESQGEDRYRRGLYIFLKRTILYPTLTTFDAPATDVSCSRRDRSNSPMQALALLNDPVFHECAEVLGKSLHEKHGEKTDAAIVDLYERCLNRAPEPSEIDTLLSAYADFATESDPEQALAATARVILNLDEFITRD
jgi:hypothetical protein